MIFHNVHLAYGNRVVLHDLNVEIRPGEFVFLIGASGSGKTSFIRSLIGEMSPKSGNIYNDKKKDLALLGTKEILEHRRKIGVIFQDFKLLPKKTVHENVAFAMEVCGYDNRMISKRLPEILSHVGMLSKKEKFIETLSGWELQRTAIARALIHDPDIIIGDEPTGNLDPRNASEIITLLEKLNKEGKTIVIATHDDRLVNTLKKRVITFHDGKILSDIQWWSYNL